MVQVSTGALLAGKYRLESLIGSGGMGSVWRAEHLGLDAPVAVKLLDLVDFTRSADALNRFHREAKAAAAIRSPHVVQIFDHGFDESIGAPFIVMELMDGESLAQRLTRCGRISPDEAARIFTHVARALSRAHEAGIVHRDLKPDNVFLVRNEDEEVAKVLDFGIAKTQNNELGTNSATRTGTVMGTAYYMSPEQISGAKDVDFRSDLWAFGVMAYECLTGARPFEADTIGGLTLRICIGPIPAPSSFAPVPTGFDDWFARIVNRDPAKRFGSARDAADGLRQLCTGEAPATVHAPNPPAPPTLHSAGLLGTAAPLSHSARDWDSTHKSRAAPGLRLVIGGGVVALLAAVLWLRHSEAKRTNGTGPLPSETIPARVVTSSEPAPTAVCEANSTQCSGTTPQICVAGQWTKASPTAGQCGALCTPASSPVRCNGLIPQTCDATGLWVDGAACAKTDLCRAGECIPQKQIGSGVASSRIAPTSSAASRSATTVPASPPTTRPAKPDCDPPYSLDAQGQKHFKPQCYQ